MVMIELASDPIHKRTIFMEKTRVAFIGLGRMGVAMAGRLLKHGYELAVYNRTIEKAATLVSRGAIWAESPSHAVDGADAVFSMVADDTASRDIWLGSQGALSKLAPRSFVIECSTLSHDWVEQLSDKAFEYKLRYIDCPVTGLPDMAERGELTLLVGADLADLAHAHSFLTPLSDHIIHFGPVGCGTAYKLMINLMGAVQIAATAEGLTIAERAGLNLGLVAQTLATGQAASPQVVRNANRMAANDHDTDVVFTPPLRLKDAQYGVLLAQKFGVSTPFGDEACNMFSRLCELGYINSNESKIIEVSRGNDK